MLAACARPARRLSAWLSVCLFGFGPAMADQWLVYVGGGIEQIAGAWSERHGEVVFVQRGGTLVSVPYEEVDLATSAFITWQLNGRRRAPPQAPLSEAVSAPSAATPGPAPQCQPAEVLAVGDGETLEVRHGETTERVHAACLDTPETQHLFPELGWFGRATLSAVTLEVKPGDAICLAEQDPPRRDTEGHRILHVTLAGGHDYSSELIAGGLGLLRSAHCERAAEYREWENRAIAEGRGLWGEMGARPALAAAGLIVSMEGARRGVPLQGSGKG